MIAGIIAAKADNGIGIAGLAPAAKLLVAKVVERGRHDPRRGRGAGHPLGRGAGSARDQHEPRRRPRPVEPRQRHVLAARGRRGRVRASHTAPSSWLPSGTATRRRTSRGGLRSTRPRCRTSSASAPSTATARCPVYSNRDAVFNDIAAPGADIVSTFPRSSRASGPPARTRATRRARPRTSARRTERRSPRRRSAQRRRRVLAAHPELQPEQVSAAARAHRGRREARERLRSLRARAGRVHGLGHARHHRRAGGRRGEPPPADTLRAERRRRRPVEAALRDVAPPAGQGGRRLLGRPGRRLRGLPPRRTAPRRGS